MGLALVEPDTSLRGANLPGDSQSWDFDVGAGFYPRNGSWTCPTQTPCRALGASILLADKMHHLAHRAKAILSR
jgi:hypothetical protein